MKPAGSWRYAPLYARDAARCAALHRSSFAKSWSTGEFERLIASAPVVADGVGNAGGLLGFALSRCAVDEAEILTIAVDPGIRARGLGGALLAYHLSRLAQRGVAAVFLEVDEANPPALALYRRYGFTKVGERPGYYTQGGRPPSKALIMRCAI